MSDLPTRLRCIGDYFVKENRLPNADTCFVSANFIERLTAALDDQASLAFAARPGVMQQKIEQARADAIEECALTVEKEGYWLADEGNTVVHAIAAAIRALKSQGRDDG